MTSSKKDHGDLAGESSLNYRESEPEVTLVDDSSFRHSGKASSRVVLPKLVSPEKPMEPFARQSGIFDQLETPKQNNQSDFLTL